MLIKFLIIGSYIVCSAALLCYGFQCYLLTILFLRKKKRSLAEQRRRINLLAAETDSLRFPRAVIQLPMYNERGVAARVIEAAAAMDYPADRFEVQALDDSTDDTRDIVDRAVEEARSRGIRATVIRRRERTGYKAGALQNGLRFTDAEFVAIFDADFVPNPDFLRKALAFFIDRPHLGLVQGRWTHLNRYSSLVTRGQAMGIDGHFVIEQAARCWNGLFMNFNGTAGVFRRAAIESCGGWQHDTLTEDMDLSYRMQLAGWKTEFVPDLEVPAEIPEDINAFKNQQFRWAKGSIQTACKIIPLMCKHKVPAFKFMQAVLHLTHYAVHPFMLCLALLTMPMLIVTKMSLSPLLFSLMLVVMMMATSGPSMMYMVSQRLLGNRLRRRIPMIPFMMILGIGLAVNNAKAVFEALIRKTTPFHRTPKQGSRGSQGLGMYRPLKDITCLLELLVGLYCAGSTWMFFTMSNMLVGPFLVLYSAGFLFVGTISIIHRCAPHLISLRLPFSQPTV